MADGSLLFDTKLDTKGVEEGMTKVSTVAKGALAADIIKAGAKAMGNLGKAAIEVGMNFETSMSQVAATMGITNEQIEAGSQDFEMLKAKAKEMGATTKYTASEAAEGLNILAMAGLSAEEACASIGDVMALAGAGAMSLEQSATYVTGAVKGFNDEMANAGKYADIMAKGATMANTDVAGLGEALSRASSNATAYNQSVETTSVALLRLAEQNVTGAEAATALSRVMADLYTPTSNAAAALDKLNIATYDEQGNARDLNDVVDDLNMALSGMSDEEKLAYENTIFTTFGMKAFQKMTVSTTETVDKFKKGIAEAGGSAMQQFATQTNNLEGKLAILNSALEATGIAIYEVFEDSMKHSVDSATDAVDKLHDAIEHGALGDSLKRLAEAAGELLDKMIDLGVEALPPLIDGLTFLIDHVPMLIGAVAGYEGALAAIKIAQVAATVAQQGLNAAVMANPIGLIAGACALAVGGIVQMVSEAKEAEKELYAIADSAHEANEKITKLTEDLKTSMSEFKDSDKYVRELASELKYLNEQEKLSEQQKRRVQEITQTLNGMYADLNLTIDETTGKLAEECKGWEEVLEAKMQQARYEAVSEKLTAAMKDQADAEFELWQTEQKLADIANQRSILHTQALAIQKKGMDASQSELDQLNEIYRKNDELTAQEERLNQEKNTAIEKNKEHSAAMAELEGYMDSLTEAEKNNAEASGEIVDANGNIVASADEVSEATKKEMQALEELVESQVASFEKIEQADAISKQKVLENLQSNLDAMNNWADNMETLASRGIDEGLLQHLANMGPEGAKQAQEFVNMTGEELAKAGDLWTQATSAEKFTNGLVTQYMESGVQVGQAWIDGAWQAVPKVGEVAQGMVDSIKNAGGWDSLPSEVQAKLQDAAAAGGEVDMSAPADEMVNSFMSAEAWERLPTEVQAKLQEAGVQIREAAVETGTNVDEGLTEGVNQGMDAVKSAAEQLGKEGVIDPINDATGCQSPSVITHETGQNVARGLADGMTAGTSEVVSAGQKMGTDAVNAIKNAAPKSKGFEVGRDLASGMAEGIRDGSSEVAEAAKSMAQKAVEAAKANLKINSPSKVFEEIGQYCVAGFDKGLDSMSVQKSMGRNIQATLDNMVSGIDRSTSFNQTINMYSKAMTPDELARDMRLEAKYGWNPNLA